MNLEIMISAIGLLGIGGITGAYAQTYFQYQKSLNREQFEFKFTRYKALILLLLARTDDKQFKNLLHNRPDIRTSDDLDAELEAELINSHLYSNKYTIKSLEKFIHNPNKETLLFAAQAMRQDLFGK